MCHQVKDYCDPNWQYVWEFGMSKTIYLGVIVIIHAKKSLGGLQWQAKPLLLQLLKTCIVIIH